jgi:hypothetical protein
MKEKSQTSSESSVIEQKNVHPGYRNVPNAHKRSWYVDVIIELVDKVPI